MATIDTTSMTRFILTLEEYQSGRMLNLQQKQVLQNILASISEDRLALTYDSQEHNSFIQREAELQGQAGIIKLLLSNSEEAEQEALVGNSQQQY